MKTSRMTSIGIAVAALVGGYVPAHATAVGQAAGLDPFTLTFSENGTGSVTEGSVTTAVTGYIDTNGFLAFNLPSQVGTGDVAIADPNQTCTDASSCSDGLRFLTLASSPSGFAMEFMSADTTGGQLADTGFASDFNFSYVGATEGTDGAFTYLCTGTNCYQGLSAPSSVPEPESLSLFGAGLLGFAAAAMIRRRRRS